MADAVQESIQKVHDLMVKHDADVQNYWTNVERAVNRQADCAEEIKNAVVSLSVTVETAVKRNNNGNMAPLVRWLVIAVIGAALGSKALELLVRAVMP